MSGARIQYNRYRDGKLPPNTKLVTRRTDWGNPYKLIQHGGKYTLQESLRLFRGHLERELKNNPAFLNPLFDYNLACNCSTDSDCHADIILEKIKEIRNDKKSN